MKNYELMQLLGSMPAGAEVRMNIILTLEDVESSPEIDVDSNDQTMYSYSAEVKDLDSDGDKTIYLYT